MFYKFPYECLRLHNKVAMDKCILYIAESIVVEKRYLGRLFDELNGSFACFVLVFLDRV